ncbi:hypothetical protein BLNAU_7194 [Blattamonas nauphoetae]|uniref:Uncharacterized protein n=1 Tax=Blattamonas nauphoetae TaxID=2049346 RepID=A0ABQ9Y204_9EUKA|nr:hypothetical protein BLNAU_7194 [Blattamonas nauphoetae]
MEHGWIGLPFFCPAHSISCFSEFELFFSELDGIGLEQSPTRVQLLQHAKSEPFLNFDVNSKLSFDDKSALCSSLVALVKAEYTFDKTLQGRAVQFLKSLEPKWNEQATTKLVTELVPSSARSPSGFIDSIVTLLSSPHSRVVGAALSFLFETTLRSSSAIQSRLVESDLISKVMAPVQPHTLQISGNEKIIDNLINILIECLDLAYPSRLFSLGITEAVDAFNHHNMIFQKVVLPSSQFVTFLISNRYIINGALFRSFVVLVSTLLFVSPFHRPTLEFVLPSPIAMAFSSCLSFVEDNLVKKRVLAKINDSLGEWTEEGPEVIQSGKRILQALFSEGFEDTLEQMTMNERESYDGNDMVEYCHSISEFLGANVKRPQ